MSWPLNGSEAGGDLALIQISLLLSCVKMQLVMLKNSKIVYCGRWLKAGSGEAFLNSDFNFVDRLSTLSVNAWSLYSCYVLRK